MIITTTNRKGGVGKTSVAGNVAQEIAKKHTTLLIDADPQGSLSEWLVTITEKGPHHELADVLFEKVTPTQVCFQLSERLYILPTFSDGDLRSYTEQRAISEPFAMADLFAKLSERFDYIVVDLPPGLHTFEQSVLAACDRALPVLEPEALAVGGLNDLLSDIDEIKRKRRSLVVFDWIIVNRINRSFRRHAMYLDSLATKWHGYRLFEVPQSAAVSEAQTMKLPLDQFNANESRALPKYREIATTLMDTVVYA